MMPNVYPAWAVAGTRCKLVVSPRGTLSGWALSRSRARKHLFWLLGQRETVRRATCLHATSEAEYRAIRAAGAAQPVAVIPNGIDIPAITAGECGKRRTLLFLGRLHPVKGIHGLLLAWSAVARGHPRWDLVIAGPREGGYGAQLERLVESQGIPRVRFVGPCYGREKTAAYCSAELFVLPSHSENFGVTVAEALSHAVPVIVGRGAPWDGLVARGCGWWTDTGQTALVRCLDEALATGPEELHAMGLRGRAWMEAEFSWSRVSAMTQHLYLWLRDGGEPPDFMRTSFSLAG